MNLFIIAAIGLFSSVPYFLLETTASNPDWVSYLLQGGPFAIVLLLIIFDKIGTTGERDRLRIENETLHQEIKELNESMRKEIVPPLVQLTGLMRDVITELSKGGYHYMPPDHHSGE